jgi:hypothetical protein
MPAPDPDAHEALLERRIDGDAARRPVRKATRRRAAVGGSALMTAVALGFQHVFEPPDDEEVVLEVEASEPLDERWVTYEHDPFSPARSRATVRPWLAAIR